MRVLLTGGSGFLGYHVARRLGEQGHQLALLDVQPLPGGVDAGEYPSGLDFFRADVRDARRLSEIFEARAIDAVVHAAAALPLWPSRDIFETNVNGTRNVLEVALRHGVRRVVFISSTAVYGVPERHPICEDDPLVGVGPYGQSKIIAEKVCAESRERGLIVPVIRPKTFIGTGRMGVFGLLYEWVREGRRIPIIGGGTNRYQLLEVEDLVDAIELALTRPPGKVNDFFNVGAREFGTVDDDVGELCTYAGTGARVMHTPAGPVKLALRVLERLRLSPLYKWVYDTADRDSFVSTEKIERVLGWEPRYSNAEALTRSYQWYLDHYAEIKGKHGVTHTVAWSGGILSLLKRIV